MSVTDRLSRKKHVFKMSSGAKGQVDTRINWSELESADVRLGWSLCRTSISRHFFDSSMVVIPIPMIQEADEFDLMTCFTKPDTDLNSELLYQDFDMKGKLADLLLTAHNEEGRTSHMAKMSDVLPQKEEFEVKVDAFCFQNADANKSVEVDFTNLEKEKVDLSEFDKGQVVFNMEKLNMGGRRRLYVITEVIYADGMHVLVTVDGQSVHKRVNGRRMPVAFAYTKFQIFTTGVLNMDEADDETSMLDRTATFEEK